jgi:hypothetical protein
MSLIGKFDEIQWEALLPHLHARIILENEDHQALARTRVKDLPSYNLDSFFSNTQADKS